LIQKSGDLVMFKHIALASKCSESSVQYQKPGLDHLEHWKALTEAQHQPACTIQEQLEIAAAYRRTTEISRESQRFLSKPTSSQVIRTPHRPFGVD
jgi:hypothetical protein